MRDVEPNALVAASDAFLRELADYAASIPGDDYTTAQMVLNAGLIIEVHQVFTEDGYVLTIDRILGEPGSQAVILQHGIFGSSAGFLLSGKDRSLGFLLNNQSYDVWIPNLRESVYSLCHQFLEPKEKPYWNFSFHETGMKDLPAIITYILKKKSGQKLLYVGHSMGTTSYYVMASSRPDVAEKISTMFSLAPTVFMSHMQSPVKYLAPYVKILKEVLDSLGEYNFLPLTERHRTLIRLACDLTDFQQELCLYAFMIFGIGYSPDQVDIKLGPLVWNNQPAGASSKTLAHFGQETVSGHFRQYDYGKKKNMEVYKTVEPPDYNLRKIQTPIGIFYSDSDYVTAAKDVRRLSDNLPNVFADYLIPTKYFNHLDYLWAKDVKKLLYDRLFSEMEKFREPKKL